MGTTTTITTADELLRMPRDGTRRELVCGELRTMSPAGFEHGAIVAKILGPLCQFVIDHQLGITLGAETGFKIAMDPDTVLAPDVAFVRRERITQHGIPKAYWPGAPDLAVEVVSPGDTVEEVDEKVAAWLAAGAQVVWVVKPKRRTLTIYRAPNSVTILTEGEEIADEPLLPGYRSRVSEFFPL
jgi:Uma2 family endonuclease